MGILIKGMTMPVDCYSCPCARHDTIGEVRMYQCNLPLNMIDKDGRIKICPLVEVPDTYADDLASVRDVIGALVYKGQCSKRYKWGESWELNMSEILDALKDVPPANAPKAAPNVPDAPPVYAVSADDVIENMEHELELCNRVLDDLDITGAEREIHSRVAEMLREQIDFVKGLPQVEPEPRKGKWIWNGGRCHCSECNYYRQLQIPEPDNYCPKCGAKMEGEL